MGPLEAESMTLGNKRDIDYNLNIIFDNFYASTPNKGRSKYMTPSQDDISLVGPSPGVA